MQRIAQGVLQQRLATKGYGRLQAPFPHLATLNAFQSWTCFAWAWVLLQVQAWLWPPSLHAPPLLAYWRPALTNCVGPACGFQALHYISYPAKVLAKSCKLLPVMVLGTVLYGRRYKPIEYLCCLAITGGVALFALRSTADHQSAGYGAHSQVTSQGGRTLALGYALCFANLVLDGYTNSAQDEIHLRYSGGTALHMMCWMNAWSGAFYIPFLFGSTSVGSDVVDFCLQHRDAAADVLHFCLCGALGQLFIFCTIKLFGSLVTTVITTTRKFFSILMAVVVSGSALGGQQWGAVGLIFTGLAVSTATKHTDSSYDSAPLETLGFGHPQPGSPPMVEGLLQRGKAPEEAVLLPTVHSHSTGSHAC